MYEMRESHDEYDGGNMKIDHRLCIINNRNKRKGNIFKVEFFIVTYKRIIIFLKNVSYVFNVPFADS